MKKKSPPPAAAPTARRQPHLSFYDLLTAYTDMVQRRHAGLRGSIHRSRAKDIEHWNEIFKLAGVRSSLLKVAVCLALRERTDLLSKLDDIQVARVVTLVGEALAEYKQATKDHFGLS